MEYHMYNCTTTYILCFFLLFRVQEKTWTHLYGQYLKELTKIVKEYHSFSRYAQNVQYTLPFFHFMICIHKSIIFAINNGRKLYTLFPQFSNYIMSIFMYKRKLHYQNKKNLILQLCNMRNISDLNFFRHIS